MYFFQDFPLYFMKTLTYWCSLHGFALFMLLTTVSKVSACEAPSSPECFRRKADDDVYICEWSMNTTESNVTFDLHVNQKKFKHIKETSYQIPEESLIKYRPVDIWVAANVGVSSCISLKRTVELMHIVKYEVPQNISMSWLKSNLSLIWEAAEKKNPALVEVWFQRDGDPTKSWEKKLINTTMLTGCNTSQVSTSHSDKYQVIVTNLLRNSVYRIQMRQRSTQVKNPLWSKWTPLMIVPAELENAPKVTMTTKHLNGTRKVTLTWEPLPHPAVFGEVTYRLDDTQSSQGCRCPKPEKRRHHIKTTTYTIYLSHSAANISIYARNTVGNSPVTIIQVPAMHDTNLKPCDIETLLDKNLNKKNCKQWYELQDKDPKPKDVTTLTRHCKRERIKVKKNLKDFVRYLYYEHRCNGKKPQTIKTCLFYKKEGVPQREPQNLSGYSDTYNSVILSWTELGFEDLKGFLTYYSLCSVKISSQDEPKECHNISAKLTKYRLENLTPGAKYNFTLAALTQVGEGPKATVTYNILPEKQFNVWLSFGLLSVFFLGSTTCTVILKRIKNKIFPPVPTPVITNLTPLQPESQPEMLEGKEEVHDLLLLQLHPEGKPFLEDAVETAVVDGEWGKGSNKEMENERSDSRMSGETSDKSHDSTDGALSSKEGEITDLEQLDNEIAMLVYRNGLVFDVKMD